MICVTNGANKLFFLKKFFMFNTQAAKNTNISRTAVLVALIYITA